MGFSYLNNKNWIDISREERLYCAHLYEYIRKDIDEFIRFLFPKLRMSERELNSKWEVGYEVCFYRDYLKHKGESIKSSEYSDSRTFDFCLFSEDRIIIIEAKVHEIFKENQINNLIKDQHDLPKIIDRKELDVNAIAIASNTYFENFDKKHESDKSDLLDKFNCRITWTELADLYNEDLFHQAESIYGR